MNACIKAEGQRIAAHPVLITFYHALLRRGDTLHRVPAELPDGLHVVSQMGEESVASSSLLLLLPGRLPALTSLGLSDPSVVRGRRSRNRLVTRCFLVLRERRAEGPVCDLLRPLAALPRLRADGAWSVRHMEGQTLRPGGEIRIEVKFSEDLLKWLK